MPSQSITLPFKAPDLFAGFAEGKGLAKASPSELDHEFVVNGINKVQGRGGLRASILSDGVLQRDA